MSDSEFFLTEMERTSLAEKVHTSLTDMILSGQIEDGERISIDVMARSFGVSATPIREALGRLAGDGLVRTTPHRGYVVASVWDTASFDHMHEARMVVEPYASRVAARRVKEGTEPALVDELERCLGRMVAAVSDVEAAGSAVRRNREWARYDLHFHQTITDVCGNPLLSEMVQRLRPQPHLVKLHTVLRISFDGTIAEHRAIIDAIREGSEDMAARAMEHHLIRSCERLRPGTAEAGRPCGRSSAGIRMSEGPVGDCCSPVP